MGDRPYVTWDKLVWNRLSVPKYRFITWMEVHNKLQTFEKLVKFEVTYYATCLICSAADETNGHLFFSCRFSNTCLIAIKHCLGISDVSMDLHRLISWISRNRELKLRK